MQGCITSSDIMVGRLKTVELAYGCPDQMPEEDEWKLNGLPTSATWDLAPETLVSDADNGGISSTMISNLDPTYSIEGEVRTHDRSDEFGIQQFVKYVVDEIKARRQPTVWMRLHWGDYYHIGYMNATGISDGGGVKEIVTYSLELKLADGTTFQVVEDGNAIPVTAVVVAPKTASVEVGKTVQLSNTITPTNATNKTVSWKSSDAGKATVTPNGLVTGVAAGKVTITATTADGGLTDTSEVTVTAP
ncbi:Ig-like domain-containing protein [Providencia manganoxydans]|uniref:Ig-like domain-containing protein n=1 Tax=Providencia manganoxydans TaxID=2923283 RepID=UPI0034E3B0D0